uniref:Uncharacterized protein n=1 Tax=Salix viminalis TaxID=40686 RepID=A0A6N2KTD2_SALVM
MRDTGVVSGKRMLPFLGLVVVVVVVVSFSLIDLVFEDEDGKEHAVIGNNVWKQEEVVAIVRNRETFPSSSTITILSDSATDFLVNEPSCSCLGTKNPTFFSSKTFAFNP